MGILFGLKMDLKRLDENPGIPRMNSTDSKPKEDRDQKTRKFD